MAMEEIEPKRTMDGEGKLYKIKASIDSLRQERRQKEVVSTPVRALEVRA